ncbi:YceI family protein [Streptomyces endophyticus]|uniref:YceI family protein n=1 Tax=Streptomyces endophyticus TaxID=714166 RepID=A0ABU6F8J6_9ACTN|nr:YceI family protein [Streptomyces endophyticus]MEB8340304.1 YceI family protein [Streptomyces endophyticus]
MPLALFRRKGAGSAGRGGGPAHSVPPGAGGVHCEVTDPFGQPMPGAEVTVTQSQSGRVSVKATTDPFGLIFVTLQPGRYSVLIAAEGLEPFQQTVEVVEGETLPLTGIQLHVGRSPELPQPGTWMFDPPHTAIRFIAKHVGMAHVHGRFTRFEGGIQIAPDMADSRVEVRIDAASITTGNNTRDNHLRSADFLDVENYPYVHFSSDRFIYRGGSKWTVQGALTMHGVSRTVDLETGYLGVVNGGYAEELRCAALATAELHREDYTLNWRTMLAKGIAVVGPTVKLEMDLQAMYRSADTPTPPE